MTCHECESLLATGVRGHEIQAHVAGCAECRALAGELEANAEALYEMRDEVLPHVRQVVNLRPIGNRPGRAWWIAAAAAAALAAVMLWPSPKPIPVEAPRFVAAVTPPAAIAPPVKPKAVRAAPAKKPAPLTVKILTDDPDVVIYWLLE